MKILLVSLMMVLMPAGVARGEGFACNSNALTKEERAVHQRVSRKLLAAIEEKKELRNGYAFRLDSKMLVTAAEWVSLERRCCPFLSFDLGLAADGPLWVRITGAPGIKAFLRAELGL